MRIIGATLTPFEDTFKGGPIEGYYNTDKEQKREAVNQWIRSTGAFDRCLGSSVCAPHVLMAAVIVVNDSLPLRYRNYCPSG